MAIDPCWIDDPKNDDEFWTIIEEMLRMAEYVLIEHRVETREEALAGTVRLRDGGAFRDPLASFIRYRGVHKDVDSRDYFLELGRKFLPKVARQIKARRLTLKFARDWGVVMTCHGFISAHILDNSDGLSHNRAGFLSAKARSKEPQRKWVARQILAMMKSGLTRVQADANLGTKIDGLIETGKFPLGFDEEWFNSMLDENRALRDAYCQKRLPEWELKELASQPCDDIPPINFSR